MSTVWVIRCLLLAALFQTACDRPSDPAAGAAPGAVTRPSNVELHGAPPLSDEDLRELFDISRDLQAVATRHDNAIVDLADDLARLVGQDRTDVEIDGLARAVGAALEGRTLDEGPASRLAVLLYVMLFADALTPAEQAGASRDLAQLLGALGVPRAQSDAVVAHMPRASGR